MTVNSSANSIILILFAFSDSLSAENSNLSAESGLRGLSLLESMIKTAIFSDNGNLSNCQFLENQNSTAYAGHLEQKNELFAIFWAVMGGTYDRKIVKKQLHLAKFGCVSGAILVIFSDFGLGQPKRHFFDTFFQFWP